MAVTCVKVLIGVVVYVLLLLTYVLMVKEKIPDIAAFAGILGLFAPCLASIPIKYYHDESKADLAKINSKEP